MIIKKPLRSKLFIISLMISCLITILDLWTKSLVFAYLDGIENQHLAVTSFFNLVKVLNRGVSFGMFRNLPFSQYLLSIFALLIAQIMIYYLWNSSKIYLSLAFSLIIGGAFGNIIDRFYNGAVADFLDFHLGNLHWPAFNLADTSISIGVIILIIDELFMRKK